MSHFVCDFMALRVMGPIFLTDVVKSGRKDIFKIQGELAKRGSLKIQGGFGPWMKL